MTVRSVTVEAWRMSRSQPMLSAFVAAVVAVAVLAVVLTTGRSVRSERDILNRIDDAGTRSIIVRDGGAEPQIDPDAADRIRHLAGVDWVLALGPAVDVVPIAARGIPPAAAYPFHEPLPVAVAIQATDHPSAGQALVGGGSREALRLSAAAGGLVSRAGAEFAVVGSFTAEPPLEHLESVVLVPAEPGTRLRTIHVIVERPEDVRRVVAGIPALLGARDPGAVRIETSQALADVRAAVRGELSRFGRDLVVLVLAVGLLVVGLTLYADVTARRRDFGRRRALGASRALIVALVATRTLLLAGSGGLVAAAASPILMLSMTGSPPPADFVIAVAMLAVLTSVTASLPPALVAAFRDPVRILRVP